jgi:hypothetical protein
MFAGEKKYTLKVMFSSVGQFNWYLLVVLEVLVLAYLLKSLSDFLNDPLVPLYFFVGVIFGAIIFQVVMAQYTPHAQTVSAE